jgi:protein-tyrosine-phosphatase
MRRRRQRTFLEGLRVLVLDGHSRAATETVQSLGRRGAIVRVAAAQRGAPALRSRWARERRRQPPDGPALTAWIGREVVAFDPALVVPATEASLLALRALAPGHAARRRAVLPSDRALDTALDKEATRAHALAVGVPVPATRLLDGADPVAPPSAYPVVLKPTRSKVVVRGALRSLAPAIVRGEKAWSEALTAWLPVTPVQEQAYVVGGGVGVEVLYDRGRLAWAFAHERLHEVPLTGGGSAWRRALALPDDLLAATRALLDPLDWHGVAMVEFKRAPDGTFHLMEVNPRLWGSLALPIDAGVDFPLGLALLATGRDPGPSPSCRVPCGTRSLPEELEWLKANLRADPQDPLLMTRPRLRSLVQPLALLGPREHLDHAARHDPRLVRDQVVEALRAHGAGLGRGLEHRLWRLLQQRRHEATWGAAPRLLRPIRRVLVLCYGNICRSPYAAAALARRRPDLDVRGLGFHARTGRATPVEILDAAAARGVDLGGHRSGRVTYGDLEAADLILVMDRDQARRVRAASREAWSRTHLLGLFADRMQVEIDDPYGHGRDGAERALERIDAAVEGLAARIPAAASAVR